MEKGFYKEQGSGLDLLHARNRVSNKNYNLLVSEKDNHQYPVDGWYYFETKEEAETFFTSQGWVKPEEPENV